MDSDREMTHSASNSPVVRNSLDLKRAMGMNERTVNTQTPKSSPANQTGGSGGISSTAAPSSGGGVGSRTQFHAPLEPEVVQRLDELFFKFLQRICSDLDARDSKGDHIHQPLMAKKMQRLEASADFRPFKFRIQAFTNAFHESLIQHGLTEDILPLRKVKVYLWKHRYISRFNEDGKKQKSKGNHVWNIEARRIAPPPASGSSTSATAPAPSSTSSSSSSSLSSQVKGLNAPVASSYFSSSALTSATANIRLKNEHEVGVTTITTSTGGTVSLTRPPSPSIQWEFREYTSRIAGQLIKFARVGVRYTYTPRIWDAQMSCPEATYSSPSLPPWLKWHNKELVGTPGPEDKSCTIMVHAVYDREGTKCELEMSYFLTILDQDEVEEASEKDDEEAEQLKKAASGGRGRPPLLPKPTAAPKALLQHQSHDAGGAEGEADHELAADEMEIDSSREHHPSRKQQSHQQKRYLRSSRHRSKQRQARRHDEDGHDEEDDDEEDEEEEEEEEEEDEEEEDDHDDEDGDDAMQVEYEDPSGDGDYEEDEDVHNGAYSEGIEDDEDEDMAEDELSLAITSLSRRQRRIVAEAAPEALAPAAAMDGDPAAVAVAAVAVAAA
ncbi:hypothetical protein DFQ26_003325 [Actinomortierella ambigua]|nr:hypothetical protein DFQ26_003325 [Actinomortierella ambigua]